MKRDPASATAPDPEPADPQMEALKALATRTCYLCRLDELTDDDWD